LRSRRALGLVTTAVLAIVIAVLTLAPLLRPPDLGGPDKLYHAFAFGVLMLPCATLYPRGLAWLLPAALAFGGAIEIIQPWVGRSGEWADLVADAVGIAIAMPASLLGHVWLRSHLARKIETGALRPQTAPRPKG
jgi:hypothetical protein